MRIFEVKNNLVKIFYETNENLFLSGFIMIKDSRESYIGQIMHLESSKHGNVAIAKIIFNFTSDGTITSYSGTIPAINSAVSTINSSDFLRLINGQYPILLGEFIDRNILVSVDKSFLENKPVICSENQENSDLTIKTLNKQIKNYDAKTIIIDTQDESIFDKNTFIMGDNFHLPINHQLINFIYEKGIEYKSTRSKAILQETFLEIQYYLSSIEEPYIPVKKFIDILEKQYNDTKLPELVLLKNSLVKFDEKNIFAKNILEYKNLTDSLINNQTTVINISQVDENIQREVIFYVYDLIQQLYEDYYVFVKLNNGNSDKKLLKQIFSTKKAYTTINCSYSYKYLTELKKISKELILFTPLIQQQDFASYNTMLSTLGRNEFIVYGQSTQFMPLIVKLSERAKYTKPKQSVSLSRDEIQSIIEKQLKEQQKKYDKEKERENIYNQNQEFAKEALQQQVSQMVYPQALPAQPQILYSQPQQLYTQPVFTQPQYIQNPYIQQFVPQIQPLVQPIMPQYYMQTIQQPVQANPIYSPYQIQYPYSQAVPQQTQESVQQKENDLKNMQYNPQSNQNITPQHQQNQQFNKNESGIKSNSKDIQENSAVIFKSIEPQKMPVEENAQNITQEKTNKINSEENLTEEDLDAIQDVDMYEEQETEPQIIEEEEIHEEDDSYLDNITPDEEDIQKAEAEEQNEPSIEEYNEVSQEDFNVENTTQEQQTDENNQDIKTKYNITPESLKEEEHVPIYPANTGDIDVSYEKGDLVIHDKFGKGKVEKIINYGTKKLCSIYFEGLGRRLLDPSLSELKKAD